MATLDYRVSRRQFLKAGLCLAAALALPSRPLLAAVSARDARELSLCNTHTGESGRYTYWADGRYVKEEIAGIERILRDHRTGDTHPIDPVLYDMLYVLYETVESTKPFQIISGYRSPKTNRMLAARSQGVSKHSLHMQGRAIDVRLEDVPLEALKRSALAMKAGGVGYYKASDFVHLDTGRIQSWDDMPHARGI